MRRIPVRIALVAAMVTLGAGGCGTEQPAVCDSLDAVENTMHQVRNANVAENGLTQLKTDLQQLRTDLQQLRADAATQYAPEVQGVRAAADQVSASIATARQAPDAINLSIVRTALTSLQTNVQSLRDAVKGTC